jgi:hypothetical protein
VVIVDTYKGYNIRQLTAFLFAVENGDPFKETWVAGGLTECHTRIDALTQTTAL